MIPSNEQVVAFVKRSGAVNLAMVEKHFGISADTAVSVLTLAENDGLIFSTDRGPRFWSTTPPPKRKGRSA